MEKVISYLKKTSLEVGHQAPEGMLFDFEIT